MSARSQSVAKLVHKLAKPLFQPLITGPLLYVLLKGPENIRQPLVNALAAVPINFSVEKAVTALKWLFALGLWGKFNSWLNGVALNSWQIKSRKADWNWNKEVAVVTGGCSGIGAEVVKGLIRKGVKVAILDIQPLPSNLKDYANIMYFKCDITNAATVADVAEDVRSMLGPPSVLVNNAGVAEPHKIINISDEWLRKIFGVNLLSHFTLAKEFLPDMIKRNKGHVVTVASAASFIAVPGIADYAATKAGALAFHEALNQEIKHLYKAPGILTTVVHPNWVSTPMVRDFEHNIRKAQGPLLKVENVGKRIVDQIFACRGAQLILPEAVSWVSGICGWPNWMQESLRDAIGRGASRVAK